MRKGSFSNALGLLLKVPIKIKCFTPILKGGISILLSTVYHVSQEFKLLAFIRASISVLSICALYIQHKSLQLISKTWKRVVTCIMTGNLILSMATVAPNRGFSLPSRAARISMFALPACTASSPSSLSKIGHKYHRGFLID